jgi:hypothetical protein
MVIPVLGLPVAAKKRQDRSSTYAILALSDGDNE